MRLDIVDLPQHLAALDVLANPWVMGVAAVACIVELLADKVMWLDSAWDAVNTLVRPIGGALLALAIVDPSRPEWQVVVFLLGGGAALLSHGAKAGTRALVNVSPEPFSNLALSTVEDIATAATLWLVLAFPAVAAGVALVILLLGLGLILAARRLWRGMTRG
jgi:hypothetical protein